MKKNWIMRLGALALVLTLVTAALVSGTLAKYVKEVSGSEEVRVAKFAFNLRDGTHTLTQAQTEEEDLDIFTLTDSGVFGNGVNGSDKFIAPGTTGNFDITVENLSEVKVAATFVITEVNNNSIPVYYTYSSATQRYSAILTGGYGVSGESYKTLTQLATEMATAGAAIAATNGTSAESKAYSLNWAWAFSPATTQQSDATDTALGVNTSAPKIKLTVACTVTQLDT